VQLQPVTPMLEASGTQRLTQNMKSLSTSAYNFNVRRYSWVAGGVRPGALRPGQETVRSGELPQRIILQAFLQGAAARAHAGWDNNR